MDKKLTKSRDKKLSGVCAGLAEYCDMDPTLVRVIYAVLTVFFAGIPGIILYFILSFVMSEPEA